MKFTQRLEDNNSLLEKGFSLHSIVGIYLLEFQQFFKNQTKPKTDGEELIEIYQST
jgi:hypothetical protein